MGLNLLLDSADPIAWGELLPSGIFHGITTNPTLLRRANQPCQITNIKKLVQKAQDLDCSEMHLQAWGEGAKELFICGRSLAQMATEKVRIFVKLPATIAGSEAAKKLIEFNIPITLTACYDVKQMFIAAGINANYIAAYLGRINDEGRDGFRELIAMQQTLNCLGSECSLLVASLRSTDELKYLASQGLNNFTISQKIAKDLFEVSETSKAAATFNKDALLNS